MENKSDQNHILNAFNILRKEAAELYLPKTITVLEEKPTPFEFYRNWVAPNIPVLIKGGIKNLPAVKKWNKEYLCDKFKDKMISVAVTPNGYADAITETVVNGKVVEVFVLPEERQISVEEFFNMLSVENEDLEGKKKGVFYIQKQNSNLTEEFPQLLPDVEEFSPWATAVFKNEPAAINLWIGDKRAVTSLHKDPFENFYLVISGWKEFILLPPTDRPWLPYKTVPVGRYKEVEGGKFEIEMLDSDNWKRTSDSSQTSLTKEQSEVSWIAVDPSSPDIKKYPLYKKASPLKVRVNEGDLLYLPSFWFHYVRQSHSCIAVNYWYDMNFDIKYAYFQMVDNLVKNISL